MRATSAAAQVSRDDGRFALEHNEFCLSAE
jgi:hypothetical protein